MSHLVYLALGSNLGDRLANLQAALDLLSPQVHITAASPVYQTPPWGYLNQPAFLNQVAEAQTDLRPQALLNYLKDIERRLGRKSGVRYGPRIIDLDILFYENLILDLPGLTIPHPYLAERAFVLVPLNDLAPNLRHPVLELTVGQLLAQVDHTGIELFQAQGKE